MSSINPLYKMEAIYKTGDTVRVVKWMWYPYKTEDPMGIVLSVYSDTCHILVGDEKKLIHHTLMYHV